MHAIPPATAEALRPVLPALADETIAAIAAEVPDYARAMEGPFGRGVRFGVERALGRFVDAIADPRAPAEGARDDTYAELGRGEQRVGRSLDALLSAYRVGARLAWRRFVEAGVAAGLAPETLYRLGEAIFAYIDAISAESAAGYAEAQSAAAGERARRRRALVAVLAQQPAADEAAIRAAADAAGWALPREVAALARVAAEPDAEAQRLARALGLGAIGDAVDGLALVLVPDPDAPGRDLHAAVATVASGTRAREGGSEPGGTRGREGRSEPGGTRGREGGSEPAVAIGPTVGWAASGTSVVRALAAARLAAAGRLPGAGPVVADDHLALLAVHADPALAGALAARGLAPLAGAAGADRLAETLRAWLDRPGQVQAVAAVLGVHPQTVRYRLKRLRELYGAALEDPEERLALALALRVAGPDPLSV